MPRPECAESPRKYTRKRKGSSSSMSTPLCFFSDKPAGSLPLHSASTFDMDERVRNCALDLGDKALLAKLSAGDMIAIEAKYHSKCLAALYNRHTAARNMKANQSEETNSDSERHSIALVELVSYIDETRTDNTVAPVFNSQAWQACTA